MLSIAPDMRSLFGSYCTSFVVSIVHWPEPCCSYRVGNSGACRRYTHYLRYYEAGRNLQVQSVFLAALRHSVCIEHDTPRGREEVKKAH